MIAMRIGDDARPVIVASPDYLARHPHPKAPGDLQDHNCFRQRFASGVIHRWSFERRGKAVEVAVTGSLISSEADLTIRAALDGLGIARVPRIYAEAHIASQRLVPLLEDWAPRSVGFFLYYPGRRQMPAALQALITELKSHASQS
jgi:DNA-binding transcriptional LysR family regulator